MVLLHYEHICIVCLSEHEATRKYQKNLPKTFPKGCPNPLKIDAKNVLLFNIVFFGFRHRFWRVLGLQDGAKSAALLAAPGVLDPTAFYACISILLCMLKGRPAPPKTEVKPPACRVMLGPCWHIFRPWVPFFRSWLVLECFLHLFGSCWSFFSGLGSLRAQFLVVWAGLWTLQNHLCR